MRYMCMDICLCTHAVNRLVCSLLPTFSWVALLLHMDVSVFLELRRRLHSFPFSVGGWKPNIDSNASQTQILLKDRLLCLSCNCMSLTCRWYNGKKDFGRNFYIDVNNNFPKAQAKKCLKEEREGRTYVMLKRFLYFSDSISKQDAVLFSVELDLVV